MFKALGNLKRISRHGPTSPKQHANEHDLDPEDSRTELQEPLHPPDVVAALREELGSPKSGGFSPTSIGGQGDVAGDDRDAGGPYNLDEDYVRRETRKVEERREREKRMAREGKRRMGSLPGIRTEMGSQSRDPGEPESAVLEGEDYDFFNRGLEDPNSLHAKALHTLSLVELVRAKHLIVSIPSSSFSSLAGLISPTSASATAPSPSTATTTTPTNTKIPSPIADQPPPFLPKSNFRPNRAVKIKLNTAHTLLTRAIGRTNTTDPPDNPFLARCRFWMARIALLKGDVGNAREGFRGVIRYRGWCSEGDNAEKWWRVCGGSGDIGHVWEGPLMEDENVGGGEGTGYGGGRMRSVGDESLWGVMSQAGDDEIEEDEEGDDESESEEPTYTTGMSSLEDEMAKVGGYEDTSDSGTDTETEDEVVGRNGR
ncbi:hypothetical protein K402DRAFT_460250 [Aulographum hederae CBS 113979]|uniref:Uncharacterized protein n=1 Tax=Aulographum hederae CBS 113979 TaxID=1176131 RepID=A0A6G1HCR5_9PEZI|nr:hypothetical protein K402DRAFT_460250 [Aulographum hederae CBS 113979]